MNLELRCFIFNELKDGEQVSGHKSKIPFTLKKLLSYGLTKDGFPFIVWETTNMAHILVGMSRFSEEPVCKIRNDARANILLNTMGDRMFTAEKMSLRLVN